MSALTEYGIETIHPVAHKFRLLEGEELAELVDSIKASGLRESIKLDHTGKVLVDGRNRFNACHVAGVTPRFEKLPDSVDLLTYIVDTNIARRHLSAGERAMLAVDLLPDIEAEADKGGRPAKDAKPPADLREVKPKARQRESTEKAAKVTGSSGRAVSQAKRVSNEAPDLAEAVRRGDVTLDSAEKQLKRRKAQEAEADAREAVIVATPSDAQGEDWRLFNGDFRERLHEIEPGSVDLIISDPPYPAESLPLWSDLAQVAAKLLKPQGVLVALTGQIYLPEVLARLGEHLSYGWTYCQPLPGQQSRIMGRHVMQSWKPWVTFTNGQWPSGRIDWHPDMLDPSYRAKDQYRWQQDPNPTLLLIDALSDEGSLIVDPFTGTGSYGIAALQMGRKFIGVELDSDRFNGAAERLAAKETE